MDIVWDVYITDSLKNTTRQKRGQGVRRVASTTAIPQNWQDFLHVELFKFLSELDTDLIVLAIAMFDQISPEVLWIAFGTGCNLHYIPVHKVVAAMDPKICATLHVFNAFTPYLHLEEEAKRQPKTHGTFFLKLLQHLKTYYSCKVTSEAQLYQLWQFVILMYDHTMEINEARKQLFTQKSRTLENLPPTLAALEQHIKGCYQSKLLESGQP